MKRVLMAMVVVATMAGAVQAAQKPEATKGIVIHEHWWGKTSIELGVDMYRWFYDRFHSGPSSWRSVGTRSEPNKKVPVNPGELSE